MIQYLLCNTLNFIIIVRLKLKIFNFSLFKSIFKDSKSYINKFIFISINFFILNKAFFILNKIEEKIIMKN